MEMGDAHGRQSLICGGLHFPAAYHAEGGKLFFPAHIHVLRHRQVIDGPDLLGDQADALGPGVDHVRGAILLALEDHFSGSRYMDSRKHIG